MDFTRTGIDPTVLSKKLQKEYLRSVQRTLTFLQTLNEAGHHGLYFEVT
jgi:hypothetical protein